MISGNRKTHFFLKEQYQAVKTEWLPYISVRQILKLKTANDDGSKTGSNDPDIEIN